MLFLAALQAVQQGVRRIGNVPAAAQIGLHAQQQMGSHFSIGQSAVGFVGRWQLQVAQKVIYTFMFASKLTKNSRVKAI